MQELVDECSHKRKLVDWNLAAAKKRRSQQTGYVHYNMGSLPEDKQDTIPLYENFCYALALLRSRTSDHVLEAKALFEKLAAFEVGGNFPIYLHEYPECKDRSLSIHILPVLFWTLRDFRGVLGEALSAQLEQLLDRICIHAQRIHDEKSLSSTVWCKWKAMAEPQLIIDQTFVLPSDWADYLIALQIAGAKEIDIKEPLQRIRSLWHARFHLFLGPNAQEGREPAVTLFDLFFGHFLHSYAHRISLDHPVHLQAALIYPLTVDVNQPAEDTAFVQFPTQDPRQGFVMAWGDQQRTHTLCCEHRVCAMDIHIGEDQTELLFTLPQGWQSSEQPEIPFSFYCNLSDEHSLYINGLKATTFQLGDQVAICSEQKRISFEFSCVQGEGVFFGHLLRANRPLQQSCIGARRFDAHDWQIAIRTVRRSSDCVLKVKIQHVTL